MTGKIWNFDNLRRSLALHTALLSLLCCFTLPISQSIVPCAMAASDSSEEPFFDLEITDRDHQPVTGICTLALQERNVPYFFRLTAPGTLTGYCKVTVRKGEKTDVRYIYPIKPGDDITLALYAADGSQLFFDYAPGGSAKFGADAWVETPKKPDLTVMDAGTLQVCLDISRTPSVDYTIPEGAALRDIAKHYGVSAADILRFNGDASLSSGDVISIPNPNAKTPYVPPIHYVVVKGDTLQSIADAHDITVKELCDWNGISKNTVIYEDMELEIPVVYQTKTPEEPTQPAPTQPTEPAEPTQPESTEPTVADTDRETGKREIKVPLYYQDDYPRIFYGSGTVKTSGCSVVSLAMVANAITGYDYEVAELAEYFGGRAENHLERLEKGSEALGLSFHKSKDWNETWAALQEGKIAIALMDGINRECLFTNSQHFIVLTGLTEDGYRIKVNDSSKENYKVWNLQKGFQYGFLPGEILMGYSGAWIYDTELAQQPERYRENRVIKTMDNNNYPTIQLTDEERELLAKVIWAEARGESAEGQQAVAEVVFNRMISKKFSNTLKDVIYGEQQFRSVPVLDKAKPYQAQYQAIDRALYSEPILPKTVVYFATFQTNEYVYQKIGNHIFCFGE